MNVELRLVGFWILLSVLVIFTGIFVAQNIPTDESNIIWDEKLEQQVEDYLLNEEQITGVKVLFNSQKVIVSNRTKELSHIILIIMISISCGIWGGIAAYTMTFVENLSDKKRLENEKQINFMNNYNKNNLHASILVGIVASLMVPLFLTVIGSNHLDISNTPTSYLIIVGFCLLAAVFSRQFITKLADKAINQKFSAMESRQSGTDTLLEETQELLEKSSEELRNQKKYNIENSFKIALVEAQEYFSKFTTIKSKYTDRKAKAWDHSTGMSDEDRAVSLGSLNSALSKINEALKTKKSTRASCMKGNYLRQLYMINEDKEHIGEALELLANIEKNSNEYSDYTVFSGGVNWNIAVYKLLLGEYDTDEKLKEILDHLAASIEINHDLFTAFLKEDKDLDIIRDKQLFIDRFANL